MATLEVNSISQKQSISEPTIFQIVPPEVINHIVQEVLRVQNPQNFVANTLAQIKKYEETGLLSVTKDLDLRWNMEGAQKGELIPEGFKINTIERVLVYISIFTALAALFAKSADSPVEYNQIFIDTCESCYIEIKEEKTEK